MQHELLDDAEGHTAADANQGTASYESSATVLARIVGIRNRAGCQVVRPLSVIAGIRAGTLLRSGQPAGRADAAKQGAQRLFVLE